MYPTFTGIWRKRITTFFPIANARLTQRVEGVN